MSHSHHHPAPGAHAFRSAVWVTVGLVIVKAFGARISHSLALSADAAHSLGDVGALGMAWYADRQYRKAPTDTLTFGWGRVEILVGLLNALVLWLLAGVFFWSGIHQWIHPTPANPGIMALAASLALVVNLVLAWWFRQPDDINGQSTLWHLLSDAAGSLGVLVGAGILGTTGWTPINAVVTIIIAGLMVVGPWSVIRDALRVLLEATPTEVPVADITRRMEALPGVSRVHDLHIWVVGSHQWALSCHVSVVGTPASQELLCDLHDCLADYGIDHSTIQLETAAEAHEEPPW